MKRRALISVFDKTGILYLCVELVKNGFEIISTGGTAKYLSENDVPVIQVSDITHFPELFDGRVKTLHPMIHGGILVDRDNPEHIIQKEAQNIDFIDLVVVNLYPFEEVIQRTDDYAEIIENIDIGGPAMIRSAAKNHKYVTVIVNNSDFPEVLAEITETGNTSFETRQRLALKAYQHTANYDTIISNYFNRELDFPVPEAAQVSFPKKIELRYGENPHQLASFYAKSDVINVIHGKLPSYNNILDIDAALKTIYRFNEIPTVAILKHTNPCGIGQAVDLRTAYEHAFSTDPLSPYGGIVVVNRDLDMEAAQKINEIFTEIIIAPAFSEPVLNYLKKKKDRRLILFDTEKLNRMATELTYVSALSGLLVQQSDMKRDNVESWNCVTKVKLDEKLLSDLVFSWNCVKTLKSNAICLTKGGATVGLGIGQTSRIDSMEISLEKARRFKHDLSGSICASDGFFPFRDSIDILAVNGIKTVIQPGGSKFDQEVIDACDEHGICMIVTGTRHFRH